MIRTPFNMSSHSHTGSKAQISSEVCSGILNSLMVAVWIVWMASTSTLPSVFMLLAHDGESKMNGKWLLRLLEMAELALTRAQVQVLQCCTLYGTARLVK